MEFTELEFGDLQNTSHKPTITINPNVGSFYLSKAAAQKIGVDQPGQVHIRFSIADGGLFIKAFSEKSDNSLKFRSGTSGSFVVSCATCVKDLAKKHDKVDAVEMSKFVVAEQTEGWYFLVPL